MAHRPQVKGIGNPLLKLRELRISLCTLPYIQNMIFIYDKYQ
jgi:hypothetical protein